MKKLKFAFLVSLLVATLTLAGCGSKAESPSGNTANQAAGSQSTANQGQGSSGSAQGNSSQQAGSSSATSQTQGGQSPQQTQPAKTTPAPAPSPSQAKPQPQPTKNPVVTITMADGGVIKAELYPAIAPNTVKNFISLTQKGFYNGTIFHRVIPKFMIQGGDPSGNGTGGPGYGIKGEFAKNNVPNDLKHTRGVLSMARSNAPDSAGSQFFIMVADATHLDGNYAAFGKVISGLETVDKIVNTPRNPADKPLADQVMKTVVVDTFGVTYGAPEVIKK